jgi:hypothetical protein
MSSIKLPSRPGRPGRRRAGAPTPGHPLANAAQLRSELEEDDDEDLFGDDDVSELDDDDDLEVEDDDDEVDEDDFGSEGEL